MAASSLSLRTAVAQAPPDLIAPPDISDWYIVSFVPGSSGADRAEAARRAGAAPLVDFGLINALSVRIPGMDILAALQGNPAVIRVLPGPKTKEGSPLTLLPGVSNC